MMHRSPNLRLGQLLATEIIADANIFSGDVELEGRRMSAITPVEVLLTRRYRPARSVPRPIAAPRVLQPNEFFVCYAGEAAEIQARGAAAMINVSGEQNL